MCDWRRTRWKWWWLAKRVHVIERGKDLSSKRRRWWWLAIETIERWLFNGWQRRVVVGDKRIKRGGVVVVGVKRG